MTCSYANIYSSMYMIYENTCTGFRCSSIWIIKIWWFCHVENIIIIFNIHIYVDIVLFCSLQSVIQPTANDMHDMMVQGIPYVGHHMGFGALDMQRQIPTSNDLRLLRNKCIPIYKLENFNHVYSIRHRIINQLSYAEKFSIKC